VWPHFSGGIVLGPSPCANLEPVATPPLRGGQSAGLLELALRKLWSREGIISPFQDSLFSNRHFFSGRCPELY